MKKYKGYLILSADRVQSPTRKLYEGLVVLCPNGECLVDRFNTIDECARYVDHYIEIGEPEPELWACICFAQIPGKVGAA